MWNWSNLVEGCRVSVGGGVTYEGGSGGHGMGLTRAVSGGW